MTAEYLVSVDQGSTSTKALLIDSVGSIRAVATAPMTSRYPRPGWVEQSAEDVIRSVREVVGQVMDDVRPDQVAGLCLSTQRESMVLWEASSGVPLGPVISWQDRRTTDLCAELRRAGHGDLVSDVTGLPVDPMFSGTRARWLLDEADPDRVRAARGELRLGTIDSWLLDRVTGEHLTEPGNAARTQLMNLADLEWDGAMLELFGVPEQALPRIVPSAGAFPGVRDLQPLIDGTPVLAVLADSHAALFAHGARAIGEVKATYGTGSSVMGITDDARARPEGLCVTVAWAQKGETSYAVEGNILSSGSTFAWLASLLSQTVDELAALAQQQSDSGGVCIIPAFKGLGAPWWDPDAQAVISGLTLGTSAGQLARAGLDSIAYQVEDVLRATSRVTGPIPVVLADGGATQNAQLMQLQADVSGRDVAVSDVAHLSPLGAAQLGGRISGLWTDADVRRQAEHRSQYSPRTTPSERAAGQQQWAAAMARARHTEQA